MRRTNFVRLIFVIYIIGVLSLTFVVRESMELRGSNNSGIVLTPFRELKYLFTENNHLFWFMQIFLNLLLFVPLGVLLPMQFKPFKSLWMTTLAGFVCSVGIETMQYITGIGLTEVDDVIHNTLGAVIGFGIYKIFSNRNKKSCTQTIERWLNKQIRKLDFYA